MEVMNMTSYQVLTSVEDHARRDCEPTDLGLILGIPWK